MSGGADKMEEKMQTAYENEKFQWALKLAEALLDTKNKVSSAKVKFETLLFTMWYLLLVCPSCHIQHTSNLEIVV